MTAAAAGAAGALIAAPALARKTAPDYMPIVKGRMESGEYQPYYVEREITAPTLLCDETGRLNPEARGYARTPLFRANLKGHWPRKKRWNFWNWISPEFVLSATMADIDYGSFCAVTFDDFQTGEGLTAMSVKGGGHAEFPEEVEKSIAWKCKTIDYAQDNPGDGDIAVRLRAKSGSGKEIKADFTIVKPKGHETLNVVVPWSDERFQMNSKHNTLPIKGEVLVDGRKYVMDPETCHGVQDFGRGMWPYRSYWNWGVATGTQGGDLIGINTGAKWTTGTGANENGICLNGKLFKIMEDLEWTYDVNGWMKPWRVRSVHTDIIDMTLTPFLVRDTSVNGGLLATGGACSFGKWKGVIRPGGREIRFADMIGWAEEFKHRW
jgi:hypothetical protein